MGNYIGTLDSGTYMPSFIGSLKDIIENDFYYSQYVNDSNFNSFFMKVESSVMVLELLWKRHSMTLVSV